MDRLLSTSGDESKNVELRKEMGRFSSLFKRFLQEGMFSSFFFKSYDDLRVLIFLQRVHQLNGIKSRNYQLKLLKITQV